MENAPINSRIESLKETSAVLWNARQKLEQLFCMQMYIASEILLPIFAPSKVWIANMNLMAGLSYRLDLIYDMYLKARGDLMRELVRVAISHPKSQVAIR